MSNFGTRFGDLIRGKRGVEALSQDALAARSGLTKARISDLENGKIAKPQVKTVDALCVALNLTREERAACHSDIAARLPLGLLEILALRFGLSNPNATEDELEGFLRNKAEEFREMQKRLEGLAKTEGAIAHLLDAARTDLERGDFTIADIRLGEAEQVQLVSATLPAITKQCDIRFQRGFTSLLKGDIKEAVSHWEKACDYLKDFDLLASTDKRYEFTERLREFGYRYRDAEALSYAKTALLKILQIWNEGEFIERCCKALNALGGVNWRLAQFDQAPRFREHIQNAKEFYELARAKSAQHHISYYNALSTFNLASIYREISLAFSEEQYREHLKIGLDMQISTLNVIEQYTFPIEWGILQHNIGCTYTAIAKLEGDRSKALGFSRHAVAHLRASFSVRSREKDDELQYWIASCRSLGEALIAEAQQENEQQSRNLLREAATVLMAASTTISEAEHPLQWEQLQEQLADCK